MLPPALLIQPASQPLSARVRVPGSKSLTNRVLMLAALADGTTQLTNALFSDDALFFAESLSRLGFDVHLEPGAEVNRQAAPQRSMPSMTVTGQGGRLPAVQADLYVGNAGTAARFLTAMLTLGHGRYTLDGDSRMRQRPMRDLIASLQQLGAEITPVRLPAPSKNQDKPLETEPRPTHLPICVRAAGLAGGRAGIAGDASSQFLSALLMAAPYARQPVELKLERGLTSRPFVDMTLAVMADFGVQVERDGYDRFIVEPQKYRSPGAVPIESDATSASYFFAAALICGGTVRVEGITRQSKQGDVAFLDILAQMGGTIAGGGDWISVTGPQPGSTPRGVTVDLVDIPDTAQTLAAAAPFASTPTTIHGITSARHKETDRVAALCRELSRIGVSVAQHPDGLTIYPCRAFHAAEIQTYHDHRMAMAFALIGLRVPGITILDPGCVSKTFPGFYQVLARLQTP